MHNRIIASVGAVITDCDPPYAVCYHPDYGDSSITVTLKHNAWKERWLPKQEDQMKLIDIAFRDEGWRAKQAQIVRHPSTDLTSGELERFFKSQGWNKSNDGYSDLLWQEWVDKKTRGPSDLGRLLENIQIPNHYKVKALAVLFTPHFDLLPFYWNFESYPFDYPNIIDGFDQCSIPSKLWGVAESMVLLFHNYAVLNKYAGCVLERYHTLFRKLMKLFPVEAGLRLFEQYNPNDYEIYNLPSDKQSGYNPLRLLWEDTEIPEQIRIAGDTKMRRVIESELDGTPPQAGHEKALECYINILRELRRRVKLHPIMYDARNTVPPHFFLDRLDYVLKCRKTQEAARLFVDKFPLYETVEFCRQYGRKDLIDYVFSLQLAVTYRIHIGDDTDLLYAKSILQHLSPFNLDRLNQEIRRYEEEAQLYDYNRAQKVQQEIEEEEEIFRKMSKTKASS